MILLYARTFLETYRTSSVTKASENLNITQPAASAHIKGLENYLRRPLFTRNGRGVQATAFADELARNLSVPLDKVEQTLIEARKLSTDITGSVYITGPNEFISYMAANNILSSLKSGVNLRFKTGNRSFTKHKLENNQTDLAIFAHNFESTTTDKAKLYREYLLPVATPQWKHEHWFKDVNMSQLLDKEVLTYDEDFTMINQFFGATLKQKYSGTASVCVPDLRIVKAFVLNSAGFSVLPDYLVKDELEKGLLVSLNTEFELPYNDLFLVWNKTQLREERVNYIKRLMLKRRWN